MPKYEGEGVSWYMRAFASNSGRPRACLGATSPPPCALGGGFPALVDA
jgi:hypothetical protein